MASHISHIPFLGAANGIATLDGTVKIPVAQLPDATTATKGVVELATDGEVAANVAVQANDSRLSNARTPSGAAGGDLAGSYPSPTVSQSSTAFALNSTISPTTLAADANDYNPAGLAGANTIRLTSSAAVNLTGLQGGAAGRVILLHNANAVGGSNITLTTEDPNSTAANRFAVASNIVLAPSASCPVQYDTTSSRWRALGVPGPSGAGGPPSGAAGGDLSGTYPNPTVRQSSVAFALNATLSPASFSTQQDDYNPAGLSTANTLRLTATAAATITGLQGGAAGRVISVQNVGSVGITLANENASSTAANRFTAVGDLVLLPNDSVLIQYDSTSSRWRFVGTSSVVNGAGAYRKSAFTEVLVDTTNTATTFPAMTTIAAGSNNVALPTGTINVASTAASASNPTQAAFPASGTIRVMTSAGLQTVTYTGITGTTFTGCTGGTGIMNTGNGVMAAASAQDLLTLNVATQAGGILQSTFTGSISNATNNSSVFVRLVVDGVRRRAAQYKSNGGSAATGGAIVYRVTGLAAITHSIIVQWRVDAGTAQVRPVGATDAEHACLLANEVAV